MLTQTGPRIISLRQSASQPSHAPLAGGGRADTIELLGACMSFPRNAEIYGENEPSDYLYKIVSGTVRTYKVLVDGRRQIGAFYLPGDMFGIETSSEHAFSAEAITDCKIIVIKRSAVLALAARDNEIARQMWDLTARELHRLQEHSLVLIKSAEERVAGFLLEMADYLGLTIETISRTLKHLEDAAAIEVAMRRRILLRNRSALRQLNA